MRATRQARGVGALCAAMLAAILGSAVAARAQGNIELGPFRLLPSLELSGEYDDNILLTPDDEIDDFIWIISPGLAVELPARRYTARIGYRADILRYTDNTELDTVHHTILGDLRVNFPGGLGLRLSDLFLITDEFGGFPVPELTERVDRTENTLSAGADYTVRERYTIDVGYKWFVVDYDDADFDDLDREDHTVALTLFYRIFPKTSVLGEFDYNLVRYEQVPVALDRDSDAWRLKFGVKGDLTAKTSALIKLGWEWRDYDNRAREDWDGFIAEGEVIWKYREPSEFRLFGGRANVESLFEDATLGNNYYIANYGGLEVRHFLSSRLIARLRGLAGVNDYPDPTTLGGQTDEREDLFYEAGASLRYQIRTWLAVEVGYQYLARDSNFDEFDYTVNRVKGSIILTY
jgi:Putative beta-barrel porin 2